MKWKKATFSCLTPFFYAMDTVQNNHLGLRNAATHMNLTYLNIVTSNSKPSGMKYWKLSIHQLLSRLVKPPLARSEKSILSLRLTTSVHNQRYCTGIITLFQSTGTLKALSRSLCCRLSRSFVPYGKKQKQAQRRYRGRLNYPLSLTPCSVQSI